MNKTIFSASYSYTATISSSSSTTLQHKYKAASLGNLPTSSALTGDSPGNEKNLSSHENSFVVDSLPKHLQQHYNEKGDVLSSQQPTFVASSVVRENDKCNGNANSSESSSNRGVVHLDNKNNVKAFQANTTSLFSSNEKADISGLPVDYSSYNLKHNLTSSEQGIRKFEKGKSL